MSDSEFRRRQNYSDQRIQDVRERISATEAITRFSDLCIYATGSLGRREASEDSDLDIFFIKGGKAPNEATAQTTPAGAERPTPEAFNKDAIFAVMDRIRGELRFPDFTKRFLDVHYADDIIDAIGSPSEDAENKFTARMLMLLEGVYLFNEPAYKRTLGRMINEYFRDYHDNQNDFIPVFLINDIIRFWKTMCLNYENRRNADHKRRSDKRFRLKYSRLVTCFSMIAPLISERPGQITEDAVLELASLNPWQRLVQSATISTEGMRLLKDLRTEYAWFLRRTADRGRLDRSLEDPVSKEVMFEVANRFNQIMYDFLKAIGNPTMLRFLAL